MNSQLILTIFQILITAVSSTVIIYNQIRLERRNASSETKQDIFMQQTNKKLDEIKVEHKLIEDAYYKLDKEITNEIQQLKTEITVIKTDINNIKENIKDI